MTLPFGRAVRGAASLLRTSMYEASWVAKKKSKSQHDWTSSAFHIVCRTACSLYLSGCVVILLTDIQLNQGSRKGRNCAFYAQFRPLMPLPSDLGTHSFFVNQATTRHNISENRCCAYIVRCTWSSIVIVLRLFLNYPAIHRHGCLWKWDMGHGCPVSNGSGNYHYVYEKS